MAVDSNLVVLVGRLTRDPEVKSVGEHTVASFALAVGDYKDAVSFIDCKAWNQKATVLEKYAGKGKQVCVVGRLRQERWEKDGQKRSKLVVNVNELQLLGGREATSTAAGEITTDDGFDQPKAVSTEDIPF